MIDWLKIVSLALIFSLAPVMTEAKEKTRVYHTCTKNDSRQDILACAMYAEGRGEGKKGMLLIGNTILNRTNHERFPNKIRGVVFQKKQFSYTQQGDIKVTEKRSWKLAQDIAKGLIYMEDNFPDIRVLYDPSKSAIMFHSKRVNVYWSKMFTLTVSYRNHKFYR